MKKNILIIDDDQDLVRSMQVIIGNENYNVNSAGNGKEGYVEIKKEKPDLLLLDIMMDSDLEGYNLLHQLKRDPLYKTMPVILFTGMLDEMKVNFADGADDPELLPNVYFQHKPVDPLELLEKIDEILR